MTVQNNGNGSSPTRRMKLVSTTTTITSAILLLFFQYAPLLINAKFAAPTLSSASLVSGSSSSASTQSSCLSQRRQRQYIKNDASSLSSSSFQHTALGAQHSCESLVLALGQLRGGGGVMASLSSSSSSSTIIESSPPAQNKNMASFLSKTAPLSLTSIFILILSIQHWDTIKTAFSTIFDASKFRNTILQTLSDIASMGNAGLLLYSLIFIVWEVCGLPTSVVETAAGMAFGFRKAFLGSFLGKSCGSSLAFLLGRTLLSDIVRRKLLKNVGDSFQLIERGVQLHPIRSAFIVRYSVLPQIIKNFGISMTRPVSYPIFLLTIIVHGLPFSLLWAALGYDSSLRLRNASVAVVPKNHILNGLLVFVTVFGFVVSPAITGWWLADLRKEA